MNWRVEQGDCVEVMAAMPEASVDAIVTDPPYGLGFMGKQWDSPASMGDFPMRRTAEADAVNAGASRQGGRQRAGEDYLRRQARDARAFQAWCETWAVECLRVLKPGGHLLAFGGTRMAHRMASAIEDAGFEIRDTIAWMYGSGFPKSHNLDGDRQGWGTALKPAHEPIVVARKALSGTVAQTVALHGTGALNIDGCRVGMSDEDAEFIRKTARPKTAGQEHDGAVMNRPSAPTVNVHAAGRWPANVILDAEAGEILDEQTGNLHSQDPATRQSQSTVQGVVPFTTQPGSANYADKGGASRFFYCAKADSGEREAGLAALPVAGRSDDGYGSIQTPTLDRSTPRENWEPKDRRNVHPTVKPIDLMRWLVRLVTPPGGTVLDPFVGSGTTGCASVLEAFDFIGIEREAEYAQIARARIEHWEPQGWQMEMTA